MTFLNWLRPSRRGTRRAAEQGRRRGAGRRPAWKPAVEALEGRTLPSVFTVTTAADTTDPSDGALSLREAIQAANGHANDAAGPDVIQFNIAGTGVHTLRPTSALPAVTDPVVIDGYSQPGASANTLAQGDNAVLRIELDGSKAGADVSGLTISAGQSTVKGLVINRFDHSCIVLEGAGGNTIQGNFLGTDADGGTGIGGRGAGVFDDFAGNNLIGGTDPAARNVISGNRSDGIELLGNGNSVLGNYLGTDRTGTQVIGNGANGIEIHSANNTIGGAAAGAGNIISGNEVGIGIYGGVGGAAAGNSVQGNYIGTDVTGTVALANGSFRGFPVMRLVDAPDNTITSNLISGNRTDGVGIAGELSTGNVVTGNRIGIQAHGAFALGNTGNGVHVFDGASNNTIGGAGGEGNTIAFSGGAGVFIESGSGNAVVENAVFGNAGLGIDLGVAGVTPNDPGDADVGANGLQNAPVVTAATSIPGRTQLEGSLSSTAGATFRLEFFANPDGDGEGKTFLGAQTVTTDAAGNAAFSVTFTEMVPVGGLVTATATDAAGNTSEFSPGAALESPFKVTNNRDGGIGSLRQVLLNANFNVGTDTVTFAIGAGPQTIRPGSALPTITEAVVLDGTTQLGFAGVPVIELVGTDAGDADGLRISGGGSTVQGLIINGFSGNGVRLEGLGGNTLRGNVIGTGATGTFALGNGGSGVFIDGPGKNVVGGTAAGAGNTIAFNGGAGVFVNAGGGSAVQANAIFGNGGLGIDLGPAGVTANDLGDGDTGANGLQNFPVLTSEDKNVADTVIKGTLNGAPNTTFRIEFFGNAVGTFGGFGQGQTFLGAKDVVTGPGGNATFTATLPVVVGTDAFITATATDPDGNTSEFSRTALGTLNPTVVNGTGLRITFRPDLSLTLTAAAEAFGYDHFNWYQLVTKDPSPPPGQTPPYTDPPYPGGYDGQADALPYYWDEGGSRVGYRLKDNINAAGTALTFLDYPTPAGGTIEFTTSLVGVKAAGSGQYDVLATYKWYCDGTGKVGLRQSIVPPGPGVDVSVFGVQEVSVNELRLEVRQKMVADGAQNVALPTGTLVVQGGRLNDGSAQRSMVTSLTLTFSGLATFDAGAFTLARAGGGSVTVGVDARLVGGQTVAVLTFSGPGVVGGSLADGEYTLTVHADKVHDGRGQELDGDGSGLAGGDFTLDFARLFGDGNGDGDVSTGDFKQFQTTFGKRAGDAGFLWYFDYDGNGVVDARDRVQLAHRTGQGQGPLA